MPEDSKTEKTGWLEKRMTKITPTILLVGAMLTAVDQLLDIKIGSAV